MVRITHFIGVDGGGTGCRARIVDAAGTVRGNGTAGPGNTRIGTARAFANVLEAIDGALAEIGLTRDILPTSAAGLGLAGLGMTRERARLMACDHPFAALMAVTDAQAACLGAHGGGDGGVAIVGTGTCGCVISGDECVTLGGWGFGISDFGSGAELGFQAVRRALQAHDGIIARTDLSRAVMARFHDDPDRVRGFADDAQPADFGALAPMIVDHARARDALARRLMAECAAEVEALIAGVRDRGADRVALMGGFGAVIAPWLSPSVRDALVPAAGDALDGALMVARRAARDGGR